MTSYPRLVHIRLLTLIDVSLEHHNLKVDEKLLYLTTFCQFGRHSLCEATPTGDMLQTIIDKLFSELLYIFGITSLDLPHFVIIINKFLFIHLCNCMMVWFI